MTVPFNDPEGSAAPPSRHRSLGGLGGSVRSALATCISACHHCSSGGTASTNLYGPQGSDRSLSKNVVIPYTQCVALTLFQSVHVFLAFFCIYAFQIYLPGCIYIYMLNKHSCMLILSICLYLKAPHDTHINL